MRERKGAPMSQQPVSPLTKGSSCHLYIVYMLTFLNFKKLCFFLFSSFFILSSSFTKAVRRSCLLCTTYTNPLPHSSGMPTSHARGAPVHPALGVRTKHRCGQASPPLKHSQDLPTRLPKVPPRVLVLARTRTRARARAQQPSMRRRARQNG